ncbi:hypothetical protein [Embleya scabrispora]|uniref:hypothetical protein n=1 Tax=Embleya scabrispora TaxID=159449 RepID=UPI00037D7386|nr:hypothetical protein [Embleya scabrispora]MYS86740.1 hypothetical protein [Streptomyces sp. SID5474]
MITASTRTLDGRPAPIRLLHPGPGGFFRAHRAWYTGHATDTVHRGIASFTGSSTDNARRPTAQGGMYTLIARGSDGDRCESIASVGAAHPGADRATRFTDRSSPDPAVVTPTVTEAGRGRTPEGGLDSALPAVTAQAGDLI